MIYNSFLIVGTYSPTDKHVLSGTTDVNGTLCSRRVVVMGRGALNYIASTRSHNDGTWQLVFGAGMTFADQSVMAVQEAEAGEKAAILDLLTPGVFTG